MSDVRFLASLGARGTGIPRTSTQVPQRNPAGAAVSHVSASPAAGARAQAQVLAARRPPGPRQEAAVTIVDRRAASTPAPAGIVPAGPAGAGPAIAASQFPTVQIVERTPAVVASPFTHEQMMLVGHLLDRYLENTTAINDTANAAVAEGALGVLAGLLQGAGAPIATASAAPLPAPSTRARGARKRVDASAVVADGPPASSAGDASVPSSAGPAVEGARSAPETPVTAPERT